MASDHEVCNPEVAGVVAYEFRMFAHLCDKLQQSCKESATFIPGHIALTGTGSSSEELRELSGLLESLLLHTRVLRDFFCKAQNQKRPDDVIASDFVDGWEKPPPSACTYLDAQKERLDKALAHLTTTRVKYNSTDKRWDITAIRSEIQSLIEQFITKLPSDRSLWFSSAMLDHETLIP